MTPDQVKAEFDGHCADHGIVFDSTALFLENKWREISFSIEGPSYHVIGVKRSGDDKADIEYIAQGAIQWTETQRAKK